MLRAFREALTWLHTWSGVVVGIVLFAIFWTGTLSVFDRELDRWLIPSTRIELSAAPVNLDAAGTIYTQAIRDGAPTWNIFFSDGRTPVTRIAWFGKRGVITQYLTPDGSVVQNVRSLGASGFFYPFHYTLMLRAFNIGLWLVGVAAMTMLVLCVSGIIIHRKIFADFFTFRPHRKARRAILDLHNLLGVLGLPFHLFITLSGLIIFYYLYLPSGWIAVYGANNLRSLNQEVSGVYYRSKAGTPAQLSSLPAMIEKAQKIWPERFVESLTVYHPGDAAAFVQINLADKNQISKSSTFVDFDGMTGQEIYRHAESGPVAGFYRFVFGLHIIQFDSWLLRWLYFFLGLFGCGLIWTGLLFWIESRRRSYGGSDGTSVKIVRAMAAGGTTGILAATAIYFVANRLAQIGSLPPNSDLAAFFICWPITFVHAAWRGSRAWQEQALAIGVLCVVAIVLNGTSTGAHLLRSTSNRHLWSVGGTDIGLFVAALAAFFACHKLLSASGRSAMK